MTDRAYDSRSEHRFHEYLLSQQEAIHERCYHPKGDFTQFRREEIEQSIPARFESQARQFPHRLAVQTDVATLTYAELNRAANGIARALLSTLGEDEEPVILVLGHDARMIAAILGALKAGKFYVPLDPMYPLSRNARIVDDSGARLIVSDGDNVSTAQELVKHRRGALNVDDINSEEGASNLGLALSPDRAASLLYTSGSAGAPKGVIQSHRNALHATMLYVNSAHLCPHDRFSLLHSCSVSASVRAIYGSLLNGGSLHPYDVRRQGLGGLAKWANAQGITVLHSTPTLLHGLMASLGSGEGLKSVRLLRTGGEPLARRHVELYKQHFPDRCVLLEVLGSTEAYSLRQLLIDKGTDIETSIVPAGFPVPDQEVLLLDDDGAEVRPGEAGEIAIRSRYLAMGYWRRPDLTRARFRADPDGSERRVYHSGDLGRMSPSGCLVHLGRKDFQIKIRGYRVEAAEVEAALLEHSTVREAAVIARRDASGAQWLAAYWVPEPGEKQASTELRRALAALLPEHMIPSQFVMLDKMPLTPNGKIDRRSLPEAEVTRRTLDEPYVPPASGVETQLAGIWQEVLGIGKVGTQDDFFLLGGHSLLAMQIVAQVRERMHVKLPLMALYEAPTVAGLARSIEGLRWAIKQPSEPNDGPALRRVEGEL